MPLGDRLRAVLVAVIWGLNFPAIHLSLAHFPPFFLVALRFALIAAPTLLFVRPPAVARRWILGYGAGFGVLQFFFLYLAMDTGMPTGLASLVLQSSAPFTVLLAGLLLRERLTARQGVGIAVAVAGLAGIGVYRAGLAGGATLLPVVLTLCGGLGWALGNLCNRQARAGEPFRLMLWMTVVPPLPMLALSFVLEAEAPVSWTPRALFSLVYLAVGGTVITYQLLYWLLPRISLTALGTMALLDTLVAVLLGVVVLREPLTVSLVVGGVLILSGAGIANFIPPDMTPAPETPLHKEKSH